MHPSLGAVYVEDRRLKEILKRERRNNVDRPITDTILSHKFIDNVLDVLGQASTRRSPSGRRC